MGFRDFLFGKTDQNRISVRNSSTTERQIALFQNYSIEELDKQISRLAWLYAVRVIDDGTLQEIISKNEKKEIVILQLNDLFFREGATFRYLFATDWYDNCENTDVIAFSDWNNLPKKEKQDFPNAVVEFFIDDGSEVCERYESKDSGGEGSGIVRRFREAFKLLAEVFTDYYAASGVKRYTMVVPEADKVKNAMPMIYIGVSDHNPRMGFFFNFDDEGLKGMSEKDARALGCSFIQAAELLLVNAQAYNDYVDKKYSGMAVTAPPVQGGKTVLDFLTEVMQAEENESLRLQFTNRVKGMRDGGMSDDEIVNSLGATSWCKSYVAMARKKWEEWKETDSPSTPDPAAGNEGQKTPPTPDPAAGNEGQKTPPAPVSAPTSGSGGFLSIADLEYLQTKYHAKSPKMTPSEWKLTVFAGIPEAQRDFEPGQPLGDMPLCLCTAYQLGIKLLRDGGRQKLPAYLENYIDAEIRLANQGN